MTNEHFGFIGLGNMGGPMARNVCEKGLSLIVHDIAGTADRAPPGAQIAQSNDEVARRAGVIALSLPSVEINRAVVQEIAQAGQAGCVVVDTCTSGLKPLSETTGFLKLLVSGMSTPRSLGLDSGPRRALWPAWRQVPRKPWHGPGH